MIAATGLALVSGNLPDSVPLSHPDSPVHVYHGRPHAGVKRTQEGHGEFPRTAGHITYWKHQNVLLTHLA